VTPFIWQQPSRFRLLSVTDDEDHSHHRWTVDTIDDLQFVRTLLERWPNPEEPGWRDVLHLVESASDLASINAHVAQKTIEP
jgi:spore coat polysaccharide biosynthesis protein SpsF